MALSLVFFLAFLGAVLPAILWLSFWLLEDRCEPEPKQYIFFCFLAGMAMVVLALPIEQYAQRFLSGILLYAAWAATEEILKFGAAYFVALRWGVFNEPIDAVIYLVTAALGFSMVENALFLVPSIVQGDFIHTLLTGDMRFIGATLLHTLASATIGITIALAYNQPASVRIRVALGGVILAIALHALFNFFILSESGGGILLVFLFIWIGIIALLLLLERVKIPQRDYC